MIRFRATSSITNQNAFWTDVNYNNSTVAIFLTSSFSGEGNSNAIFSSVDSAKFNGYGSWILISTLGTQLPTGSGQYTINIYGATTGDQLRWSQANTKFGETAQTWGNVEGSTATSQLLSSDRAYISGSDYDNTNTYNYQDNPVYAVYNG